MRTLISVLALVVLLPVLALADAGPADPITDAAFLSKVDNAGLRAAYEAAADEFIKGEQRAMKSICKPSGSFPQAFKLFREKRWTAAARRFKTISLSGEPGMRAYAMVRLAECRMRQKQYRSAVDNYLAASMALEGKLGAWCTLGVARAHLDKGDKVRAQRELQALIHKYDRSAEAKVARALLNGMN